MRLLQKRRMGNWMKEYFSKLLMFLATAILCLWMISGARAASLQISDIKSTTSPSGDENVRITLSDSVTDSQVVAEFQRNFLQLSIKGASAFPAKNSSLNGHAIDKVFIYQYQPDLARARILFKAEASALKDRVRWTVKGKNIEISVTHKPGAAPVAAAKPEAKPVVADKVKTIASSSTREDNDNLAQEDERLIKQILNDPVAAPTNGKAAAAGTTTNTAPTVASATNSAAPTEKKEYSESEPLFADSQKVEAKDHKATTKAANPVSKMISGLLFVLGLMGAIAFGFKKFVLQGKFRNLGFGGGRGEQRMIDMVSSYMLSPKKSIAVVRVGKQYMVLGVTDNAINLIQNLGADAGLEKYLDDDFSAGASNEGIGFNTVLSKKMTTSEPEEVAEPAKPSIRSLIKQRMEGFKPL